MSDYITVYKGRTKVLPVTLGKDVSKAKFKADIRVSQDPSSALVSTWSVLFATDGTDGELLLTLDRSVTMEIDRVRGYMFLRKLTDREPIHVFEPPLEVRFVSTIAA
jgi:hypothetical protein